MVHCRAFPWTNKMVHKKDQSQHLRALKFSIDYIIYFYITDYMIYSISYTLYDKETMSYKDATNLNLQ